MNRGRCWLRRIDQKVDDLVPWQVLLLRGAASLLAVEERDLISILEAEDIALPLLELGLAALS